MDTSPCFLFLSDECLKKYQCGRLLILKSFNKEAIESSKQVTRIMPDWAAAFFGLGIQYDKLGMYKEAIKSYKQAIRIMPDHAYAHYYLAFDYLSLDDRGSALEEYKILKNLDKEKANKLFNLIYP